jgi:hypothetical protein
LLNCCGQFCTSWRGCCMAWSNTQL